MKAFSSEQAVTAFCLLLRAPVVVFSAWSHNFRLCCTGHYTWHSLSFFANSLVCSNLFSDLTGVTVGRQCLEASSPKKENTFCRFCDENGAAWCFSGVQVSRQ